MTIAVTHTVPDDVLLAYSTGQLPEVFDLVVAAHVSLCDDARARLDTLEALGGSVLDGLAPATMTDTALTETLARLSGLPDAMPDRPVTPRAVLPQPIRTLTGGDLDAVRWSSIGRGCKQAILLDNGAASARLFSIPPGVALPDHGHQGLEMTLVLQGAFADGDAEFGRGDVALADEDIDHAPAVIGTQTCICLAAADSRLRFHTFLPRLAQRFLRI